jgi:anti-anti-sigma factor
MKSHLERVGRATVLIADGRLDFGAAAAFQAEVDAALAISATMPGALIIDCGNLDYVSSAGLRVFMLAARAAQQGGIGFAVCALKPAVRDVLALSGFDRIIAVHADRATALRRTVAWTA